MSLPVHLVPSLDGVSVGVSVTVEGDEAHHAVAVRRLRAGESVVLTDGAGRSVTGRVTSTGKRIFEIVVDEVAATPRPTPSITVAQAIPKGDRGELAVEVLTEIGVETVVPWTASRCVAVWRGERAAKSLAKWRTTVREAAKQSRRTWFPQVTEPASTADLAVRVMAADLVVVLHEEAETSLGDLVVPETGEILVIVGPEGGIAPEELTELTGAGAVAVRLGTEVLRTSTAGLAAVSALLARTSRWTRPGRAEA